MNEETKPKSLVDHDELGMAATNAGGHEAEGLVPTNFVVIGDAIVSPPKNHK